MTIIVMITYIQVRIMDTLPAEMLMVIASFLPGSSIGKFCLLSTTHNRATQPIRRRLYLIRKVRGYLMSNIIQLMRRRIYYCSVVEDRKFDPVYNYDNCAIMSYNKYKELKESLLNGFSNISFACVCLGCNKKLNLNHYIFDSVDEDDDNLLDILCSGCYHRGVIGYYQVYGKLPGAADTYRDFVSIIKQRVNDAVPVIPLTIIKYFDRLEGGHINFRHD